MGENGTAAMNPEEYRTLIRALIGDLKTLHRELTAHRVLAAIVQKRGISQKIVDSTLQHARRSGKVQEATDQLFQPLDELLQLEPADARDQELRELLAKWNPIGQPN